jgi:ankyrin repeat protein
MIPPIEMQRTLPITLHGATSTTTEVWEMLCACRDGNLERAMELIAHQPALATCQFNYTPPLHFAVREGHLPLVRALIESGGYDSTYKGYPFGDSLQTMAQDRGHDDVVQALRHAAETPGLNRKWADTGDIDFRQDDEERQFDMAVQDGNLHDVERLLHARPELARNELSSWAEGVLMMPAKKRNRPLLELLMQFGARVPAMSKWGRFYYFVHNDIASFLLERGMSARHVTWQGVTLLHDMAQTGELRRARLLLEHGAEINVVDDEYRSTPLGMAARWGLTKMVRFLLERGADPNRSGASWSTPVAWAKLKGHARIANDLIAAGARDA